MKRTHIGAALLAAAPLLVACAPTPADQITEIEVIRTGNGSGVSVETYDGNEYGYRKGLPCNVGEQLSVCADNDDLLTEQHNARKGDGTDYHHEGEESDDTDE